MANDILILEGTAFTLNNASTPAFAFKNLASAAGYVSGVKDLGATFARRYAIVIKTKFATAPTAGHALEFYAVRCNDGSGTKRDGLVTLNAALGAATDRYVLLFIGVGIVKNNNTEQDFYLSAAWEPQCRYNAFCIYNDTTQALTNTDADHEVTFTPLKDQVQ